MLEAQDPLLKRTVAIKILSPWRVLDEESKARFLREAQAATAITHENVVGIYAVEEVDGLPFLVLEYVAGESLDGRLRRDGRLRFSSMTFGLPATVLNNRPKHGHVCPRQHE